MWDRVKINYSVCVHGNERTCHPVQQCGSLMYFNTFWITMELFGTEEEDISGFDAHTVLVSRTYSLLVFVFSWDLLVIRKMQNIICLMALSCAVFTQC